MVALGYKEHAVFKVIADKMALSDHRGYVEWTDYLDSQVPQVTLATWAHQVIPARQD